MKTVNQSLLAVGAALACETRVRLLLHVLKEPTPVGRLSSLLQIAQSTCSHHVAVLVRSGLVEVEADGSRRVVHPRITSIHIPLKAA